MIKSVKFENRERERVNLARKFFNSYFLKTAVILSCVGFLLFLFPVLTNAAYEGWTYKKSLTDANSTSVTDFQVRVSLTSSNFDFSHANSDGSDLRFWDATSNAALPYWIESWDDVGQTATIWVKVTDMTHATEMYYGNVGVLTASDGKLVFESFDDFNGVRLNDGPANAAIPQVTPTYDGSGQMVHPSIVYFETAWHGYKYWLAMTPYPNSDDSKENPSILASNDGAAWEVPAGLSNPIVPYPGAGKHNDDPELFYDSASDQLWLYYNYYNGGGHVVRRLTSSDGITWSVATDLFTVATASNFVSPSVSKVGSIYYMYSVNSSVGWGSASSIEQRTSLDGVTWSVAGTCTLSPAPSSSPTNAWHVTVRWIPDKAEWWAMYNTGTTNGDLYLAKSTDGIAFSTALFMPHTSGWDAGVYRSTFLYDAINNKLRLWYNGVSSSVWHLGYAEYVGDATSFLGTAWRPVSGAWSISGGLLVGVSTANLSKLLFPSSYSSGIYQFSFKLGTSDYCFSSYRYVSDANRYLFSARDPDSVMWVKQDGSGTQLGSWTVDLDKSTWYKTEIAFATGVNRVKVNDTERINSNNSAHTGAGWIDLAGYTGTIYFDNAFVRKYATTEPSITLGTETSIDATLSNLTISTGTLTPIFASETTSYTASVNNGTTSITVTPTANDSNSTISVNDIAVTSGEASDEISLDVGENVVTVEVTAQDTTTTETYTVTVARAAESATTHTITATAGSNGSISPSGSVTVNDGDSQTFTITPNSLYRIDDVLVDGLSVGNVSSYQFTNVTEDHTITASFVPAGNGSWFPPPPAIESNLLSSVQITNLQDLIASLTKQIQALIQAKAQTTPTNPSSSSAQFTQTIQYGSNGTQVKALQDKLKQLGFFPQNISSNGNFGPATLKAVQAFQIHNKITQPNIYGFGIVGPKTRAALNSL